MTRNIPPLQTSQILSLGLKQPELSCDDFVQDVTVDNDDKTNTVNESSEVGEELNLSHELFSEENCSIAINGEIEESKQGYFGDCWMLSSLNILKEREQKQL